MSKTKTYVVLRKHVNLRNAKGEPFCPAVGDEVELTDHQASRVVNKVRLADSGPSTVSGAEMRLTKANETACAERDAAVTRVAELTELVQSQAVELEKLKKTSKP
jgi:hypothetical protein